MADQQYQQFVNQVVEAGDDTVRGIVRYQNGEFQILCKRKDVETGTFQQRTEVTIRQAIHKYRHSSAEMAFTDPDRHVELFTGVAVVHFREDADSGVVVSLDLNTNDLQHFVNECHQALEQFSVANREAAADD